MKIENFKTFKKLLEGFIDRNNISRSCWNMLNGVDTSDWDRETYENHSTKVVYYHIGNYLFEECYYCPTNEYLDRISVSIKDEEDEWVLAFLLYPDETSNREWIENGDIEDLNKNEFIEEMTPLLNGEFNKSTEKVFLKIKLEEELISKEAKRKIEKV